MKIANIDDIIECVGLYVKIWMIVFAWFIVGDILQENWSDTWLIVWFFAGLIYLLSKVYSAGTSQR